jgi:hypothetical protein
MENQELSFPEEIKVGLALKNLIKQMLVIEDAKRLSWPDVFKNELFGGEEKLGEKEFLKKGQEEPSIRNSIKKKVCCCFGGD